MLNSNRKLIVGSGSLFISSKIMEQFPKDHDIVTFNYDSKITLVQNSKMLFKYLQKHLDWGYDKYIFMGNAHDCNLCYALYKHKNLLFDAAVFVNYEPSQEISEDTQISVGKATKIFSYTTKKTTAPAQVVNHQSIKTVFGTVRSERLAQDIYSQLVYGVYEEMYLEGPATTLR